MPRLLDAFCGEGGAGYGYALAGWEVVGVDVSAQALRRYPFESVRADAVEYITEHGAEFDAIHTSPPCQAHSSLRHMHPGMDYTNNIPQTRAALQQYGPPLWVIENVQHAPLIDPVTLCGTMFDIGLHCSDGVYRQLRRHRQFETSFPLARPAACRHYYPTLGVYGTNGSGTWGFRGKAQEARDIMGMQWPTRRGLTEAIPPAYTQHIGTVMLQAWGNARLSA